MNHCVTYHYDRSRRGLNRDCLADTELGVRLAEILGQIEQALDPFEWFFGLDVDGAFPEGWGKYQTIPLGSAVRGAPLFLNQWEIQGGPHNGEIHNLLYVTTSENYVYAFAEDQLRVGVTTPIWSQWLGFPSSKTGSNIPPPVGICSTPVIDPENQRIFVMALKDDGTGHGVYSIYALDVNTGQVLQSALVADAGAPGRPTFDGDVQDQRGALNLVTGRVYATFAAFLAYDLGNYHGWVVGCNANNLNDQWFFPLTKNVFGGGAWGPGGVAAAVDDTLYAATGNATTADDGYWKGLGVGAHPADAGDVFEGVVRLGVKWNGTTGSLTALDWYVPTNARALNDADLDLGGSSVLVLPEINGREMLVVSGKDGDVYLLDRLNMGKWGNELWRDHVFSAESKCAPAHLRTSGGDHYVFVVGSGTPGLVAYIVAADSSGASLTEVWRATGSGITLGDAPGSPVVASAPYAKDFAMIWITDAGDGTTPVLRAFNALNGNEVYNSSWSNSDDLGPTPHFPPITCVGESVFVGTADGLACYGPLPDND